MNGDCGSEAKFFDLEDLKELKETWIWEEDNLKLEAEDIEKQGVTDLLDGTDGILIPGGFGDRGSEGKIRAVRYARENKIPFLGICLGMQIAVTEFARNVCEMKDANSVEFDPKTEFPVIHLMDEQKEIDQMGGTMRLGAYPCVLKTNSIVAKLYRKKKISERHRHRYEFNNEYRQAFADSEMVLSGRNPERDLVEIVELANHPFFIGVQFHPEFKSNPFEAHPLFRSFIGAALRRKRDLDG